jgi:polyribonucleotide nucleotidyltransferase
MVKVKVLAIDDRGKVKLSMRSVDQATGEEIAVAPRPPRDDRPRGDREGGGGWRRDEGGGGRRDDGDRRPRGGFPRRERERVD